MIRILSGVLLLCAAPIAAQGLLIGPDPASNEPAPPSAHHRPARPGVHIVRTKVQARIVDGVATTTIDQVIANTTPRIQEGTWFLPLPAGAVADAFTMSVDGKEISGEVLDAGQARQVYESIVRRRRDPGLLEYAGDGMLRARIFPIPANGEVGVTVRLRQVLDPTGGMFEWSWPVRVAKLGDVASGPIGLDVQIESSKPLATIVTPHPTAEIRRDGERRARVSLEGANGDFEDLRVLYGLAEQEFGLNLLTWRAGTEPGYFAMLVSPPRTVDEDQLPPRLVQLVVDTSGSMKGAKIAQAKASLHSFLASLRPEDRFQIITFASSVQTFFAEPQPATAANVAAARERVDGLEAMGGTNIAAALSEALRASAPVDDGAARLAQVIFVTDGQPTVGVTDPELILSVAKEADDAQTRVFALGVGDQIDVRLIDDLVAQHRGARDFVGDDEKIEAKVDALCQKLSRPALTDVVVQCDGLDAQHVHPTRTRDLFCGEMMQVVGRYRDHGARTVRVRGRQNGVERVFEFPVTFPKRAMEHDFVQTLWARQHVASLLDEIRRNGAKQELVDEVRQLATSHGIVTPYTSQLIVEESMRLSGRPVPIAPGGGGGQGHRGGRYRGPGDVAPAGSAGAQFGTATPRPTGPTTGGPSGPSSPAPSSSGPAGRGPATGGPATGGRGLADLGRSRTGREAVEESKAVGGSDDFFLGSTRKAAAKKGRRADSDDAADAAPLLRRAAGRTFVTVGEDLVEQGLPAEWRKQVVVVEAFSKDYFALLKQNPELRAILALGERIVFGDGERIVHVRPEAKADEGTGEPTGQQGPAKASPGQKANPAQKGGEAPARTPGGGR